MNNQERETKELSQEQSKSRKRKILTDPDRVKSSCKVCKEVGNPENLIIVKRSLNEERKIES